MVAKAFDSVVIGMTAGQHRAGKRKREEGVAEAAKVQSPVAAWISQARTPGPRLQLHATASLQQQSGDLLHHMLLLGQRAGHGVKREVTEARG